MRKILGFVLSALMLSSALAISCAADYDYDLDDFYGLSADNAYDLPDYTDEDEAGVIVDLTDGEYLDEDEIEDLEDLLQDTAERVGFNVGVVVTDYIPNAVRNHQGNTNYQEDAVYEYTDYCFDEIFGKNNTADGVLLIINYYTLYDYILADGEAQTYINDSRTQEMFDDMYAAMKAYDAYAEVEDYAASVVKMYNRGSVRVEGMFKVGFIGLIIGLITAVIIYFSTKSSYSKHPKTSANTYINRNNTNFTVREDRFIRQYTTRVRNSSSSGGGGRSGGGGGGRSGGGRGR